MGLKEIIAKFLGKPVKQPELPTVAEKLPNQSQLSTSGTKKHSIFDFLKSGTYIIDMEKDYLKIHKNIEESAQKYVDLIDEMYLTSLGYSLDEGETISDLKKIEIENTAKKYKRSHGFAETSYKFCREFYVDKFSDESFKIYIDVKSRQRNGEKIILSEEQKRQLDFIERLLAVTDEYNIATGTREGMRYTVYKHLPTTEESTRKIKQIENDMEEISLLSEYYLYLANVYGIEDKGNHSNNIELYRLMCLTDKSRSLMDRRACFLETNAYQNAVSKYSRYLEYGGKAPSLDVIDKEIDFPEELEMSDEELEERKQDLTAARKLKEEGKLDSNKTQITYT